ncbi:membrane protein YjeT [Escherichia coli]|uniref:Membrane protein YjeT n=1 Tax=Escherichia coli TaxID=562 RepID=A0A376MPG5_ECOLX|nr:membrane protein YjeT [Escherichia coli]
MNSTIWLALALVLVLEGLGPMLYPKAWKKMISAMTNLPDNILRRFWRWTCGCGRCGLLHVEENDWLNKKQTDRGHFECKKCCNSEKAMVESIFKQTVILKNG